MRSRHVHRLFLAQSRYGVNTRYFIYFTSAATPTPKAVVAWVAGNTLPTSSPHSQKLSSYSGSFLFSGRIGRMLDLEYFS